MEPIKTVVAQCAPPHCKCPTIDIFDNYVIIKDDYRGEVILTFDQFESLYEGFKELLK